MYDMKREEQQLMDLLKEALTPDQGKKQPSDLSKEELDRVIDLAEKHSVLSLLYDRLMELPLTEGQERVVRRTAERVTQQNYHLLFLAKYLTGILEEEQIASVLLKGSVTASYYPVPELRKSGDVDLFVSDQADLARIRALFMRCGIKEQKDQHANHHISFDSPDGITIEMHTELIEQTGKKQLDSYVKAHQNTCLEHRVKKNVLGVELYSFDDAYHAYFLLIHMVEDFLRAGFGLKLLCDWVVVWNHGMEDEKRQTFLHLVTESGILGFARMITAVCVQYLGLKKEQVAFLMGTEPVDPDSVKSFLRDVLEAEEFGKSGKERMVVLQQGGLAGLVREFQHQVQLTYPNASKHWIGMPVLWVMLLFGFIHRNRTLRKVSTLEVIKSARKRGRQMEQMDLFE